MKEFDPAEFSKRLRYLRKEKLKMTTHKFSALIGVHVNTLSNYERQGYNPSAYTIYSICRAFGVSADWLLGLTEEEK